MIMTATAYMDACATQLNTPTRIFHKFSIAISPSGIYGSLTDYSFPVFFSSMAPLGILAGTAIDALISSGGRQLFEAVFDSVGAGTFLYIATLDIIRTEFELPGDQWQKWVLASMGFGLMALLALWI